MFVGTFTAGNLDVAVDAGKLLILEDGKAVKFVDEVEHRTFSGPQAAKWGKTVLYITERCVFKLTADGLELTEIAPGIDLQKDILDKMQFKPIINQEPTLMDARIFAEEPMNIRAEMLEMPMSERLSFDPDKNLFFVNFAGLSVRLVKRIGMQAKDWFDKDLESRSAWDETIKKGIEALGIHLLEDDGDAPFEGACMATHPLVLEAAVKYQSKASAELLPASGPVKTQVLGVENEEKLNKANRVRGFMNYQTTRQMTEYYPDMERLLFYQPLMGSAFKKTYWDFQLQRPVSCFISSDNFVINNNSKSLEKARRYSEILPPMSGAELKRKIVDKEYLEPKEWRSLNMDQRNLPMDSFDVTGDNQVGGAGVSFETGVTEMINKVSGQVTNDSMYNKVFTLV